MAQNYSSHLVQMHLPNIKEAKDIRKCSALKTEYGK